MKTKIPTIILTDFHILIRPETKTFKDWKYVEYITVANDKWNEYSYHVLRYLPTNKLYKTRCGTLAPDGYNVGIIEV